ncbi:MAG: hypothetical protein R2702_04710 [Acidimicrobiales bacterium]
MRQPFTALPLGALALAVAALVATLVLAGCGAGSDGARVASGDGGATTTAAPTVPDPGEGDEVLDADQIVFQAQTGGGFVPMQAAATELPEVTVYGDGRVLVTEPRDDRPFDVSPRLLLAIAPDGAVRSLLADAEGSGLFAGDVDFGQPMATDLPTTTVTLHGTGPAATVSAYALGFTQAPGGGITDEQAERRAALRDLIDAARALGEDGDAWTPDRVRATLFDPASVQREGTIATAPWPGPPFTSFPAPAPEGAVARCLVIEGDDAATVWSAASARDSSWWTDPDDPAVERQIVVVPVLPGTEGCPAT